MSKRVVQITDLGPTWTLPDLEGVGGSWSPSVALDHVARLFAMYVRMYSRLRLGSAYLPCLLATIVVSVLATNGGLLATVLATNTGVSGVLATTQSVCCHAWAGQYALLHTSQIVCLPMLATIQQAIGLVNCWGLFAAGRGE